MEINLTAKNFQSEVIEAKTPVLVDFWAPWCGPCKLVAPYLEQLAKEYEGKLKVCKLNVDEAPDLATKYTIMSIPALLIFKDGKIMEKRVGAMGKNELEKFSQAYL
ncbi:MAG: thioredoxin [Candidatus Omnitrophica bacterium]|nr:thioredoxin [Candidatus Omnitrophota bacterium]MBU2044413.1 thioredoxin [Candidatus Omnitrophota bacterium]MBU2473747.1 thioredoxin [Candidatus Omnitrophota bacterium]